MPTARPLIILILFLVFIIPNLIQIIRGQEYFPFSNNPMFGHNVELTDSLATVRFTVHTDNREQQLNFQKLGLWEVRFKRYYFSNVFGSSEYNSPQRNPGEDKQAFVRNHEAFFGKLEGLLAEKNSFIDSIKVSVDYFTPEGNVYDSKIVGTYVASSNKFKLH